MKFLEYSLQQSKPIKAVLLIEGQMKQCSLRVLRLTEEGFYYLSGRSKKEQYCAYGDVLATTYGRGDAEGK